MATAATSAGMASSLWLGSQPLLIGVHSVVSPLDAEWDHYLGLARSARERLDRDPVALSISDGGAPSAGQRSRLDAIFGAPSNRVALVSDRILTRSVVAALGWFNPRIGAFGSSDFVDALAHVGLRQAELPGLWRAVLELQARLPRLETVAAIARKHKLQAPPSSAPRAVSSGA